MSVLASFPVDEVAHLAWVDYDYRQLLDRQSCHNGQFQASGRLQQNGQVPGSLSGIQVVEPRFEIAQLSSVGQTAMSIPALATNAYIGLFPFHEHLL